MNPLNLFRKSRSASSRHPQPHMTWLASRAGRTVSRTGIALKQHLWIWPVIAVALLSAVGIGVRGAIEATMKENLRAQLQTLLGVETATIETWFDLQASNAETLGNDLDIRDEIYRLLDGNQPTAEANEPLPEASVRQRLAKLLAPTMSSHDYAGFFVADKRRRIVAASHADLIGQDEVPEYESFLASALDGEPTVCTPFPSLVMMKDDRGRMRMGQPTMFVAAPIRDASFQVIAALALQIRPEREFTRTLQLGQLGASGETYAFDKNGVLVSNSRFDDSLILLGLLPDHEDSRSILNVLLRNPKGNITEGYRPTVRRAELPLTRMAEDAIAGNTGCDVEGYRDYRGVPVVGAWTWLPKYGVGIATEVDVAEAFRPLTILRRVFLGLLALLGVAALAIFVFTVVVARLQREAQKSAIAAKKIGQYELDEKIGAGGMGVVYKGRHAMLRRPTAIKMLDVDKVDDASIKRFEREVQITCQLQHPNTIAIYDFGRTAEGVFYYAMEYLDGIDLQTLVDLYGPQPESRVISILRQVCGSLHEAHSQGLVHRDIKPANIMLNWRGGEPDVVKVLDFGLVKAVDERKQASLTGSNAMTGTPLYMSPEAIQAPETIDASSDIYAIGAVGYFLLTAKPVFDSTSIIELYKQHVSNRPTPPSELIGERISPELEHALLSCLEKSRAKRPQTARDLAQLLARSPHVNAWTTEDADAWWIRHERQKTETSVARPTERAMATADDPKVDRTGVWQSPESAGGQTTGAPDPPNDE